MARRFRFRKQQQDQVQDFEPVVPMPAPVLPRINQRVTVNRAGHPPVPSRVEDDFGDAFVIAAPNVALMDGEPIVIRWESEDGWFSLESTVARVNDMDHVPTVEISSYGRLARHDDRRGDLRCDASVPLDLRPVMARVLKPGHVLRTQTTEVGGQALRFASSSPFAPGDLLEAQLLLDPDDPIRMRLKVIRVDSVSDSWRQVCTAAYEEILRTDRMRLIEWLDQQVNGGIATSPFQQP
jgi:hypothetical protein